MEDLADGRAHSVEHARRAVEGSEGSVRTRVREVAGDLHDRQSCTQHAERHGSLESVAARKGHGGIDSLARQAALVAQRVVAVPAGLAADESAHDGWAVAGVFAPGGRHRDAHVHLAGDNGLDEGGGFDGGLTQVGREQQDVAGWAVGTIPHGGDLHAGLDRRGAPTLDGVTHDDGAGGPSGTPGIIRGTIVDDNEEVNAGYRAARAHCGRDGASDVVCSDDGGDALRLGTSRSGGIVHD